MPSLRVSGIVLILLGCTASFATTSSTGDPGRSADRESTRSDRSFEASGVTRQGDDLLFVDDNTAGSYFRVAVDDPSGALEIDGDNAERVKISGARLARDPEGIAVRGEEVLVLSEELRLVLGTNGTSYLYDDVFAPVGNRGMEGLAIWRDAGRVAALWEGGYPSPSDLLPDYRLPLDGVAPQPIVIVHDLPREGEDERQSKDDSARTFELLVGQIPIRSPGVAIEAGQRFRATDLVWHATVGADGGAAPGLIVLLGSTAKPGGEKRYAHTWLQRFDLFGRPIGAPFDLKGWLRANGLEHLTRKNWEGLGWWEPGELFVLVHDAGRRGKTHAVFVPIPPAWKSTVAPEVDAAVRLHRDALVFDGHNDLPWAIRENAASSFDQLDISKPQPSLHTDIDRMRAGNLGAQFWSVYVPAETAKNGDAAHQTLEQIDLVHRMIRRYPDVFELAESADDVLRIQRSGRIASMLGIEGGYSIENSLALLRTYRDLGVRYMTLTHADTIDWADSATDEARHGGLTSFGEDVVREMNRLGMLVDISHVSVETMKDALRVSRAPVIASHSSAFAIAEHVRNVPDDVLVLLEENGGVVMVNFFPGFIVPESARTMAAMFDEQRRLRALHPDDDEFDRAFAEWAAAHPIVPGSVSDVVDHIEHIARVAGIDHVGLGSDYDGVPMLPVGLEDVSCYPAITREMLARGHSEKDVRKVLGLNALRALREAERVAAELSR